MMHMRVGLLLLAAGWLGGFCTPLRAQEAVQVTAAWETSTEGPSVVVRFGIPDGFYVYADQVSVRVTEPTRLTPVTTPDAKEKPDPFTGEPVKVLEGEVAYTFRLEPADLAAAALRVRFQACDASLCYLPTVRTLNVSRDGAPAEGLAAPEPVPAVDLPATPAQPQSADAWQSRIDSFRVGGTAAGYLKAADFLAFLDQSVAGQAGGQPDALQQFQDRGVWLSCLLILLGGLALNLTPCVLPMIPINIAIIGAGVQASSRARGVLLGGAYGLGIALVYGALGLVVVLTGARFGTLNASPVFNLVIAAIFLLLSLGMFGLLPIDFSRFQSRIGGGSVQSGRLLTALFMGGIAALLAGACVAPVVIGVLLLSADFYSRGNVAGLLLPFLLGVGMALPWPLAGAGLSVLPRPGRWMERVKFGFGLVILAMALWYGRLGLSLLPVRADAAREALAAAQATHLKDGWYASLDEALVVARREGRPVFIDFWATWCKNCLQMDKTTFKDAAVKARLTEFVNVKFQAEDLNDPAVVDELTHFKIIGLPTYVVLLPDGNAAP